MPSDNTLVLPSPPTDVEKELYLYTNKWIIFGFCFFSSTVLLVGGWLFFTISPIFYWYSIYLLFLTMYLIVSNMGIVLFSKPFDYEKHTSIKNKCNTFPSIDVFLPCCGEPIEILMNTWKYVSLLDWPNMNIYVLDDSGSKEIKNISKEFGFNYISRIDRPYLKKAGNLRNAFKKTNSDFILILDADFCPRPDFLKEVMNYFQEDEKIAIVQTPQFFRIVDEQTWVEKAAGIIQEYFYRFIQVNRSSYNGTVCVGTCAVYRRSALIPFGGTAAFSHSEDVQTGFNLINAGWRIQYVPLNLSTGTCPNNLLSFFNQQYRWSMGSLILLMSKRFWYSTLSISQKLCYLSGIFYYFATSISIFFDNLPGILLIWAKPESIHFYNIGFALPSFLLLTIFLPIWCKQKFTIGALQIQFILHFAHFFALIDFFSGNVMSWVPTGSNSNKHKKLLLARICCGIITFVSSGLIIVGSIWRSLTGYQWYNFLPNIILALYYIILPIRVIFNL